MFVYFRFWVVMLLLLTLTTQGAAQQPARQAVRQPGQPVRQPEGRRDEPEQAPANGQAIRIGSEEVLLDLIARDKKGRPVRDLKAEEVEVFEDGVKQTLGSFRIVEAGGDTSGATADAVRGKVNSEIDPSKPINLVTMVFDNLDVSARRLARDAALDFINTGMRANVMAAVFVVNHRFYVLQSFTSDRDKLRQAVEAATGRAERQYPDMSQKIVEQLQIIANAPDFGPPAGAPVQATNQQVGAPVGLSATGIAPTAVGVGAAPIDKVAAQATLNTLRAVEAAQIDQQARASIYTFMHIAREERRLPGRKTVLYFSNGLQVPANMVDAMRAAVSEANRANVSIYAVDARGLSGDVDSDRAKRELGMAIMNSRMSASDGPVSIAGGGTDSFRSSEIAENSIRMNKQNTLAELAEGTGGFLVANTNDLRAPLRRVASELSSYYTLSYSPTARELDGKFRKITVKVSRQDVKIQTRSGYFAVPLAEGKPVMTYEAPMLAAVNSPKPPYDFPHRAAALRFGPDSAGSKHELLIQVPLSEITFKTDSAKKLYSARFSVLALVRNEKGEVVQRVSHDYPIQGKLDRLASLKKGALDFAEAISLAPGRYTLETVARDQESEKTSVQRGSLLVPAQSADLAVSSVVIVKRIDPSGTARSGEDKPLLTASGRVVPNLGETLPGGAKINLDIYLVIYTRPGGAKTESSKGADQRPQLTIELLRSGEVVSQGSAQLPAADEQGRITYIAGIPTAGLRSGAYEIRARVKQASAQSEETAFFDINNPNFVAGSGTELVTAAPAKPAEAAARAAAPSPAAPAPVETFGISESVLSASKPTAESKDASAVAVNIPDLLRDAEAAGAAEFQNLLGYTYQLRKVRHVLNEMGQAVKEEFQDYEAYPVRGRHVLIQVTDNGKPLPGYEIESKRKRAGEELELAEHEAVSPGAPQTTAPRTYPTAAVSGAYNNRHAALLIDPTTFLRACDFSDPRSETLEGREMIALDFTPRQGADLPLTTSFITRLAGTVWIDAADHTLARLEARQTRPGIGKNGKPLPLSAQPKLIYQQTRLSGKAEPGSTSKAEPGSTSKAEPGSTSEDATWVPSVIRMNAAGDGWAFYGLNWDVVFEFKEYKRFKTAGEQTESKPPEKSP